MKQWMNCENNNSCKCLHITICCYRTAFDNSNSRKNVWLPNNFLVRNFAFILQSVCTDVCRYPCTGNENGRHSKAAYIYVLYSTRPLNVFYVFFWFVYMSNLFSTFYANFFKVYKIIVIRYFYWLKFKYSVNLQVI